jgi:hypothetical protein
MLIRYVLFAQIGFCCLGLSPALADESRIFPFWGKPYPSGYVQGGRECIVSRPIKTPAGIRYERVDLCRPALHSRG